MLKLFNQPFLGRGFRPFFFFGAAHGVLTILLWAAAFGGTALPFDFMMHSPHLWHAHEMVYGFAMAIVAGFLLTAVANWTAQAPVRQIHLFVLLLIWLAGRVAAVAPSSTLTNIIILAFLPALTISLLVPLWRSWNKRNFIFLGLLLTLAIAQGVFLIAYEVKALYGAIFLILAMISLIGGRIIPAFTVAAMRRKGIQAFQVRQPILDAMALLTLLITGVLLSLSYTGLGLALVAVLAAVVHILRLRHYHVRFAFTDPMLWVLQLGYMWLCVGLLLVAVAAMGYMPISAALHTLTVGSIGTMTLGMMCRVSLGHTGRELHASPLTTTAFVLMQVGVLSRFLGAILTPEYMFVWLSVPSVLWAASFTLFLVIYGPMLYQPRPDKSPA